MRRPVRGSWGKVRRAFAAGASFCSKYGAANKLLRVPTGIQGRNSTDIETGFSRMAGPKTRG